MVAALLLVGLTVRWFLQPPTADALYNRIKAKTADGSIDSIREAETDIREFLNDYSNDPNAAEMRKYEKEIDLDKLQRKFDQSDQAVDEAWRDCSRSSARIRGHELCPPRPGGRHGKAPGHRRSVRPAGTHDRARAASV